MRAQEFEKSENNFVDMFRKFLPLAMQILELDSLPKFEFSTNIDSGSQPSFGMYSIDEQKLYVALANRHPNDILRTIAHELVHYKQDTEHKLNDESGSTGSPEENEANSIAGVVMRNFNKQYPEYLKTKPIVAEARRKRKIKRAAYGPGPYGWYGYDAGYSGDSGGIEESFDKEAEAWKKWQIDHLDRKMEMLSRLVKKDEWLPSKKDHYTAIEAGYNAMIKTGNVNDAAKAISDTFKEIQRQQGVAENFADGRNPQDKGDSARHGIRKGMTIAQLKKIRSSKSASPRKKQLAHWQINMRQGRKK